MFLKQQQSKPQVQGHFSTDKKMTTKQRIDSFTNELNEFKASISGFFSGKDPADFLRNLSVIKDTKEIEEMFKTLNEEMKVKKISFIHLYIKYNLIQF